ncbi:outer membrane protein assembly factor BamA [uncultured Methylovirgula sp.]|uniref:outer membrane protein assembly factor BamA n=1 Tax=uncultured Methylovirgula sp. TaxID=1285960 RepID=UPI003457BD47
MASLPALAAGVEVEGNHRVDSETIASYFAGADPASINAGVKALYATGLFSDIQVVHEGRAVVIRVSENNLINRVAFEGNSKVKSEQLQSEIQSKDHGPFNKTIVDADVERIKDLYRRAGEAAATVTYRIVNLPNGRVDVVFHIDEGPKTGVKQINFVGNHVYSSGKLRDLMQTTEMDWLSFFKSSDVYDPDKIASDLEAIRRFYLKNGYADFHVIGSDARYDPTLKGYVVTITVEEGVQYRVAAVNIESHIPAIDGNALRGYLRVSQGEIYNGDQVQKTVDALTTQVMRHGYAFSQVHPRGDRDPVTRTVRLAFVIDEGPRVYIERIDIRGNTRTRDYVIRREFDIGEGDAYNKAVIDRAERRLNNLGFFKKVTITNEPGSAPDRVVVVVTVEDQPTGSFSVSGGYSTAEGIIGEVAVQETNFMGRGQFARLSVQLGQYAEGVTFSFTEPYFLDHRIAAGFDVFAKNSMVSQYAFYNDFMVGGTLRGGLPVTDEITFSPRYSIYSSDISIPNSSAFPYNDCTNPIWGITPSWDPAIQARGFPAAGFNFNCLTNGEASLALKQAQGVTLTSMPGFTLSYNSLDNNRNPTDGIHAEWREDIAGAGGNERYVRSTADLHYYHDIYDEIVGVLHFQGGILNHFGGGEAKIVDNFNMGPELVRGFQPDGIGPRDVSPGLDPAGNPLGGTKFWGASAEADFPIPYLPREVGLRGAVFSDFGALWGYQGATFFPQFASSPVVTSGAPVGTFQGNTITVGGDSTDIRASVGVSLIWSSPMGPIRFDFAKAVLKNRWDQTQIFNFTGGTTF